MYRIKPVNFVPKAVPKAVLAGCRACTQICVPAFCFLIFSGGGFYSSLKKIVQ